MTPASPTKHRSDTHTGPLDWRSLVQWLKGDGTITAHEALRIHALSDNEEYIADCARRMIQQLRENRLLSAGWSHHKGGQQKVERFLLAESWKLPYAALGFDADDTQPPFLKTAMDELVKTDQKN